jgi:histidine triad (HIT) family protein
VARAVQAALKPDGIVITQFNGEAAGQTVYHLHVHVIPRWREQTLRAHGGGMADPAELRATAARIAAAIAP